MKKKKKRLIFVYLITGSMLCILLNCIGLNFGVPDEKIRDIVFENEENVKNNLITLVQEREIIKSMIHSILAEYSPTYNPEEKILFLYNSKKIYLPRNTVNGMRSYLLRTRSPDEGILKSLERMNPKKLDFKSRYEPERGFYIYSEGMYLAVLKLLGILNIKRDVGYYLLNPWQMGKIYIALRVVNILLALGSFIVIFLIGSRLGGQLHGIISSLLFLITPGIVIWNHFARPHTFSLFWILLAVYFFIRVLQNEKWKTKDFVLGCLFTGLTLSILLPYGILISLLIPLTVFLYKLNNNQIPVVKTIIIGFAIVVGTFLITNPYILFSIREVIDEYKFTRMDVQFRPSLSNYLYYLTVVLRIHLGTLLWIFCFVSIFISLYRIKKEEYLILFPFIAGFILFGTSYPNYLLRFIFFLPFAVLIVGNSVVKLLKWKKYTGFVIITFISVFLYTCLYTLAHLTLFKDDIRLTAGEWINNNLPAGTHIGLKEYPAAFRTPPFSFAKYKIFVIDDLSKYEGKLPDYFITGSFDWRFSSYEEIKSHFQNYYKEFKIFIKTPSIFNIKFNVKYNRLPADYCYFNPTVIIWRKNVE